MIIPSAPIAVNQQITDAPSVSRNGIAPENANLLVGRITRNFARLCLRLRKKTPRSMPIRRRR
jgi:hypothetical protein